VIESFSVLTIEEIRELSCLEDSTYQFFCGTIDQYGDAVLYRLGCEPVSVSREWFTKKFDGRGFPNFKDFELIDKGRVVRLGSCSVASNRIVDAWYANRFRL
jgi:hypothetical protein